MTIWHCPHVSTFGFAMMITTNAETPRNSSQLVRICTTLIAQKKCRSLRQSRSASVNGTTKVSFALTTTSKKCLTQCKPSGISLKSFGTIHALWAAAPQNGKSVKRFINTGCATTAVQTDSTNPFLNLEILLQLAKLGRIQSTRVFAHLVKNSIFLNRRKRS